MKEQGVGEVVQVELEKKATDGTTAECILCRVELGTLWINDKEAVCDSCAADMSDRAP
ncbi:MULTISPECIES: hypothetical protein [unclassified Paenibacillus]|uniref:hypothetical protein n=1 Tax=unclassified Paenibacillus TaxID=185978 RepID=UPI00362F796A